MPRLLIAVLLAAAALALGAAPASAVTITCDPFKYQLIDEPGTPTISNLRAHNLPRKTSGYAPRCLVAEAIASIIQQELRIEGKLPKTLNVYGARWGAGKWRCSYPAGKARCHSKRKPGRRVTMDRS